MTYQICYWDEVAGEQRERDSTQEEDSQRDVDLAAASVRHPVAAVPMLNLQLILIDDGKLAAVEGIIASMEGDDGARARAYWAKALTARRDNYLVEQLWPAIGYDLEGFNSAWARAAALAP